MSDEVKAFFRHCPSCGRRFEIRLVGKKLVGEQESVGKETVVEASPIGASQFESSDYLASPYTSLTSLDVTEPAVVDVRDFQYTYRCKHCGHVWKEMHVQERGVGRVSG